MTALPALTAPLADPDDIRQTADEILSRPEYQQAEPTLVERVLDRVLDRLGEMLNVAVGSGGGYWIGYGILFLALAGAGYLVWRVYPRGGGLRPRRGSAVAHELRARRSREEWLARAGKAESDEAWDEAVHARYHALTVGLADRQLLSGQESATSGEHRQTFTTAAPDPGRVQVFSQVTDRFEQVWFGGQPAAPTDSRALAEADRTLLEQP